MRTLVQLSICLLFVMGAMSTGGSYSCPYPCPANQCQYPGTCNSYTGKCSDATPKPDGTYCDDGNACTYPDTCQNGYCVGGPQKSCPASDQCHMPGVCDIYTGKCSNPNKPDNTTCNDGNACTKNDTCQNGYCVSGKPVTCYASDQCHMPGVCDTYSGQCSNPPKYDGTMCDDGMPCTQNDYCKGGYCVSGPVYCPASDQCHMPGQCDSYGHCTNPSKPNGASCSDGKNCTANDTCQNGYCTSGPVYCPASDQCHMPGQCDSYGQCTNPPQNNGYPCSDGKNCTAYDTCKNGYCVSGPVTCPASDQCHTAGVCDSYGACTNPKKPDNTSCDDGNVCTQYDTCQNGYCVGKPVVCYASDQCHMPGQCDTYSGKCSNPNAADNTPCTISASYGKSSYGVCKYGVCSPPTDQNDQDDDDDDGDYNDADDDDNDYNDDDDDDGGKYTPPSGGAGKYTPTSGSGSVRPGMPSTMPSGH